MVARRISTKRYIFAGIFTLLFFSLGVAMGLLFEEMRISEYENRIKKQETDLNSIQLQYLYLSEAIDSDDACSILRVGLQDSVEKLGDSLEQIQDVMDENNRNKAEKNRIKRIYIQDNLRYWMFSRKIREKCGYDVINILYFYSEDCDICPNQGVILSYFKKKYDEKILVFPINTNIDDNMINILQMQYNITDYPTIVINNKPYHGIVYKEDLGEIICNEFQNKSKCHSKYLEE